LSGVRDVASVRMTDRITVVLIGAIGFWAPAVLLQILSRGAYSIASMSVLPLLCVLCLYWSLQRRRFRETRALAFYMLWGIYLLGPLASTIATSASGGGFSQPFGLRDALMLLLFSIVPIFAMMVAVYNGTVVALFAITIIFIIEGCRRMWPSEKLT
jgi:hypothetical protein